VCIFFYVSGHGFGHASRDIEVVNALLDRRPDLPLVIRTPAQQWLFDLTLRHPVQFEPVETDTGIVQIDSLHLDAPGSIRRAAEFYRDFDGRASREAERLRAGAARLVVADIPPLAFEAARLVGVPSIALGNFTWDWIYAGYPELLDDAPELITMLRRAYAHAASAIRLPMHGGFDDIETIDEVPFVARRSHRAPADVRRALGLDIGRPVALLSFGGHGLEGLDLDRIDAAREWTIVTTGQVGGRGSSAHVTDIDERGLYDEGLRYEDLVRASDVVVTKPGYGIIAECLANQTAMLYTSRGRFVEYEVLVEAMPAFLRCRFIGQADLYAGAWLAHLSALAAQPAPPTQPATNGAEVAAELILDAYDRQDRLRRP
jgi:UDP:flavonoid glycosyltransferase YjiC (YdhE family)